MSNQKLKPLHRAVRIALAQAGLTQADLAGRLGIPSTSMSDWLRGAHPAPANLLERLERALGLERGSLERAARTAASKKGGTK